MHVFTTARSRRSAFALPLIASLLLVAWTRPAAAAPGSDGLTLTYENDGTQTVNSAGLTCYHEDSEHDRRWEGSMAPGASMNVSLTFCDPTVDGQSPGGTGFLMSVIGRGDFTFTTTSPTGATYSAHDLGERKGKEFQRRCVVPPVARSDGTIIGTIEPGTWTVTLSNAGSRTARDISLRVWVDMAPRNWQTYNCPSEDWSAAS